MAKTRWATVIERRDLGDDVHRLTCESDEALGHVAGNYIILRTTLPDPDRPGAVYKRAYSLSSPPDPAAPRRWSLTLAAVGPTSRWLCARQPGDRLEFSGPWGRSFRFQPDDPPGPVQLFATGTGWSPIGALAEAAPGAGHGPVAVWWQIDRIYDLDRVARLGSAASTTVHTGPELVSRVPADPAALYFLAGDGRVLVPLRERLLSAGVPPERVRCEYFLNKPGTPT